MPRVLLVCEYASLNGGERSLLSMIDAMADRDFEFVASAPPAGPLADAFRQRGIRVEGICERRESVGRPSLSQRRERLAGIVQRVRPGLLHANSLSMSRLSGPVAAALEVPGIGHLRDIVRVSRQAIDDINCHRRILAVSQATRDFHVAAGLSEEKTHVMFNGVDLDEFRPRPQTGWLHAELGLPRSALLVGAVGQLGMRKGLDVLLAAALDVVQRVPQAHFALVGRRHSGKAEAIEYERRLHAAAAAPPLAGRVHFLGRRGDVSRLLPEMALLAHAARQEPLGRVLLEAAACGIAVVATDAGGTREIFPAPHLARIVPVDDTAALARAIGDLLLDEQARAEFGRCARMRAEQAFDAQHAVRCLAEHYRAALLG